jgi:hypothetical protein
MDAVLNRWTIYMYTFPNGKRYVGATTKPLIHRQGSDWSRYKRCRLLYEAIQEFGPECIEQTILFEGLMENRLAAELEAFFIEFYRTNINKYNNPSYGYNQTDGGEGTQKKELSDERIEQLREQVRLFHEAKTGTHPSEASRRRMSEAHMGQKKGLMPMEQRLRISRTNSFRPKEKPRKDTHGPRKPVIMHDPNTGITLRFESNNDAGYYFGVNGATVTRWINGTRTPPFGYLFIREADMDPNCGWDVRMVDIDRINRKGVVA